MSAQLVTLTGALNLEPKVFDKERGFFFQNYKVKKLLVVPKKEL